jgi:hypothetical protein
MKTFQVACDPWGVSVERVEASPIFFSYLTLMLAAIYSGHPRAASSSYCFEERGCQEWEHMCRFYLCECLLFTDGTFNEC